MPRILKKISPENYILFLFMLLLAIVKVYHEPWFDESQAWLIARDSSLFDMIWHVMRYEGHTPVWHLLLFIPAKLGIPFEFGLKLVNYLIVTAAAAVFMKKSPFPGFIRLALPFTYYFFYQHGVISRNYSVFTLILWLIAACFSSRNKNPLRFCLLLALLGGTSAYGMLIAFGIAAAWFIEMLKQQRSFFGSFIIAITKTIKDKRFMALVVLGVINLFYVAILWPMPDRHTPPLDYTYTITEKIYRLLIAPASAIFLSERQEFWLADPYLVMLACLAGVVLLIIFFIWVCNRGIYPYILIPYLSITSFMTFVYFSLHHTGIYTLLYIFAAWISQTEKGIFTAPSFSENLFLHIQKTTDRKPLLKKAAAFCAICVLINQLYWSAAASANDIRLPYAPYRELAAFMQEHNMDNYHVFDYYSVSNGRNTYFTRHLAVLSYFPDNIFYNHNLGQKNMSYAAHRKIADEELFGHLSEVGKPDFILAGKKPLSIYETLIPASEYEPVAVFTGHYMWKDFTRQHKVIVYIRKELLNKFPGLTIQAGIPPLQTIWEWEDESHGKGV